MSEKERLDSSVPPMYPPPPPSAVPHPSAVPPPSAAPPGYATNQAGYTSAAYTQNVFTAAPPPVYGYGNDSVVISQPGNNIVITNGGHGGIRGPSYGSLPCVTTCINCRCQVTTSTHTEIGLFTWLLAGGILLLGCWLGCCLIPFCIDQCKDTIHTCPNCRTVLGRYAVA